MKIRHIFALFIFAFALPAIAQQYPTKPVRLLVGYAAGSSTDIVGRVGGEEFAMALPETSIAQAEIVASRLTNGCRALSLPAGEESIHWSCSIGLTDTRDSDADLDAVLRRTDAALYQAKRAGRDRWTNAA